MKFADAVQQQSARTANNMAAFKSTLNACTDLFFKIGASRGVNIVPTFVAAYIENPEVALRIIQWTRDIREGAGERDLFRQVLLHMEQTNLDQTRSLMTRIPELGRWDDLLCVTTASLKLHAASMIKEALEQGNGLCAKWMPRNRPQAAALRKMLMMTPKQYRKTLVTLTKVVETQMCANDWTNINFEHVPSLASARYKQAFNRHAPQQFVEYVSQLATGQAKVNANAVYPYDVLRGLINLHHNKQYTKTELDHITAQWNSLPNYVSDACVLPLVDVSGSMNCSVGGNKNLSCLDVAVSLGLYLSDKNTGKFKDCFLTFSGEPELLDLKGSIVEKCKQMVSSKWAMNTDLYLALDKVLSIAKSADVPQQEMPKILLILSDMQFDHCVQFDDSASQMIERKYQRAGYDMPKVVFWNLNAADNVPVRFNHVGAALVSGFSPSIMKSILSADMDKFTPEAIMLSTVMNDRYKL